MREVRFSQLLLVFIACMGFVLFANPAFAQHGGGGGVRGGGAPGGGFHGGGPGVGRSMGAGAGRSVGAPEGRYSGPRGGSAARGSALGGRSYGSGAARGSAPSGRISSERDASIRPAINDGQWHSFSPSRTSAATVTPSATPGFNRFVGGWGRGGWGRGGWGGCCWGGWGWGGWGFGFGNPYWGAYWGPAWAFGWYPGWYQPFWYWPPDNYYNSYYGYDFSSEPPYAPDDSASYLSPGQDLSPQNAAPGGSFSAVSTVTN